MSILGKLIGFPPIGRLALRTMKNRAFKPYQLSISKVLEEQEKMLNKKFERIQSTKIGKELGINAKSKLDDLPFTEYGFYAPFYKSPTQESFMLPLNDYVRISTSGTSGTEKFYLFSKAQLQKAFRETAPQMLLSLFHDGEKVTLEYGDRIYINVGPAPFFSGSMVKLGAKKVPLLNLEPGVNLSYGEKVEYFLRNYKYFDGAFMMGSTLVSQIMPALKEPIKLKGFATQDTPEIEAYRKEIEEFTGTIPKSFFASTETQNCSVMSAEHSMCFFFDWRRGLPEFLPVSNGVVENRSLGIDEVEVGAVYQLLFTHFENELTRFNTKDTFKCVSKGDDAINVGLPVFRFNGRLDKVIYIQNITRIDEPELLEAISNTGIDFIDFTARLETENGLGYLGIYVELKRKSSDKEIKDAIDKELRKMDRDYKNLADFFNYVPIKIHLVPMGVFAEHLRQKSGSAPKVARINMNEIDFQNLLQMINKRKK